jgi:signal recognition particle receptor subunit beta
LPDWLSECRSKTPGIPVLVVANKVDLPFRVPVNKITKWAKENNFDFIRTSPKTGHNVEAMFEKLGAMGVNFALKSR